MKWFPETFQWQRDWPAIAVSALLGPLLLLDGLWAPVSAQTQSGQAPSGLTSIAGQAVVNSHAYEYLQQLCDNIGSRLTGSDQDRQARLWALDKMKKIGLENVHEESWRLALGWRRVSAQAEIRSPTRQRLTVDSLGWAGSTRAGGEAAEILAVNRNQLLNEQKSSDRWKGKILFLRSQGKRLDLIEIFQQMVPFLRLAHEAGAIAVIDGDGTPETQGMNLTHIDPVDFSGGATSTFPSCVWRRSPAASSKDSWIGDRPSVSGLMWKTASRIAPSIPPT